MHHLPRIYFKLCPNDNYFNSGEKKISQEILRQDVVTIRFLSKNIGNLVAAFRAVILGTFFINL